MKIKTLFLFLFIFAAMNGCRYDVYNPDVCFQQNVLPIFVSKCATTGCHNGSSNEAGYDFSNYEGIKKGLVPYHPLRSEIYNTIKGNNPSMPVGNKLSALEVTYIKLWIKMGAQNTSNCSSCDTTAYTYNAVIKPLFANWCVGCHSSTNAGGGYDFSVYSGIILSITNNRLMGSIKQLSGYSAMPQGNKLSDCDIKLIEKWVNAGYLNN